MLNIIRRLTVGAGAGSVGKMIIARGFLIAAFSGTIILATAIQEEKKPCKTEEGKEVKVGDHYDKPGACHANICRGDDEFAVAECGYSPLPTGWELTAVDPSKGYPGCCAHAVPPLDIIPDVLDALPWAETLDVSYGDNATVELGTQLAPRQVKDQPFVNYTADPEGFYLLAMVDPDAPSVINPENREFLHWLVGNIPGSDVSSGEVLAEYIGSGPPKETGIHRYIFLLYKQPGKLNFEETKINKTTAQGRAKFKVMTFAEKYKLGSPKAINAYQAEWDDYVPALHKQLGFKEE